MTAQSEGTEDLARRAALSGRACELLAQGMAPRPFLLGLRSEGLLEDALRLAAHWLAKRDAVRWACLCVRMAGTPTPREEAHLLAAERWVADPTEENRRTAGPNGDALDGAASVVALAAFLSGGSLAPAGAPVVPPGEDMTARAVIGAVQLAAVSDPTRIQDRYREFVDLALTMQEGPAGAGAAA
jgi:hypothetical protein